MGAAARSASGESLSVGASMSAGPFDGSLTSGSEPRWKECGDDAQLRPAPVEPSSGTLLAG